MSYLVKKNAKIAHIPIMMATGTMMTIQDLNIALHAGASDYVRKPIDKIAKNGNYLFELINDILDFSKIEAGQLQVQKEPANLYDILNEILLVFSEVSKKYQIQINKNIEIKEAETGKQRYTDKSFCEKK